MRDLTEFFVEVAGLHPRRHIPISVINVNVPCNEHGLCEFDYFNRDEQRYWNHVGKQQYPSEECFKENLDVGVPGPW